MLHYYRFVFPIVRLLSYVQHIQLAPIFTLCWFHTHSTILKFLKKKGTKVMIVLSLHPHIHHSGSSVKLLILCTHHEASCPVPAISAFVFNKLLTVFLLVNCPLPSNLFVLFFDRYLFLYIQICSIDFLDDIS